MAVELVGRDAPPAEAPRPLPGRKPVTPQIPSLGGGMGMLVIAGLAQSLCTIPLSVMLLRTTDERFRGRIMGVRILAVYGLPLGLMPVTRDASGFAVTAMRARLTLQ